MDKNDKSEKSYVSVLRISWPFVLAAFIFLCVRIFLRNSGLVEIYYSEGIYPFIAKLFSSVSHLIPFSLWDIFWILIILLIIGGLVLVIFRKIALSWYGLRLAQLVAVLYSLFYIVWGFNYFRPPIEIRLGWEKPKSDEAVFWNILDTIILHSNSSYIKVSSSDYSVIDSSVEESYNKNSAELGIKFPNGIRRPKTMLLSSYFAKLGVSGYFGPFFNEVHLNSRLLPMDYAFSLAHEKSHQFGISNEAEANLAAFVICTTSDNKQLQYSGNLFLLLYFLSDAVYLKDYQNHIVKIDKEVMQDLRYRRKYYEGINNKTLNKMQKAVNDTYLKANYVEHGIKNYNQVVSLVISWYYNRARNNS